MNASQIPRTLLEAVIDTQSGNVTAVAAVAGRSIRVWGITLALSAEDVVTFRSGATALLGPMTMTGYTADPPVGNTADIAHPFAATASGEAFVVAITGAATVSGRVLYTLD